MSKILSGDSREVLKTLPDESVHCCVTSPPYWNLRDYDTDTQIGLEETAEQYVQQMVEVFRDVRRILRADGTLWLNLGDTYIRSKAGPDKPKDLAAIPWRVALALKQDGWYLRSDIIWHKEKVIPESAEDRPTRCHEYIFLLTKSQNYFFDAEAIREPVQSDESCVRRMIEQKDRIQGKTLSITDKRNAGNNTSNIGRKRGVGDPSTRNKRSVWTVNPHNFSGAHFAVFPPPLIMPCIQAGTSEHGCCGSCGAPYYREVEKVEHLIEKEDGSLTRRRTVGWNASCDCNAETKPCTVLDPFFGAGTTGLVASNLGREYVGIEINPSYVDIARRRLENNAGMFSDLE